MVMSLLAGIFWISVEIMAQQGKNIFPVVPKNLTRFAGISTIVSFCNTKVPPFLDLLVHYIEYRYVFLEIFQVNIFINTL